MEIRKVLKRTDGIKYLVVPKNSQINAGDFVMLIKVNEKEVRDNAKKGRS